MLMNKVRPRKQVGIPIIEIAQGEAPRRCPTDAKAANTTAIPERIRNQTTPFFII